LFTLRRSCAELDATAFAGIATIDGLLETKGDNEVCRRHETSRLVRPLDQTD
jgi:hypothetical protein